MEKEVNIKKDFEFQNAEDLFLEKRLKYKKTVQNYEPEDWIGGNILQFPLIKIEMKLVFK